MRILAKNLKELEEARFVFYGTFREKIIFLTFRYKMLNKKDIRPDSAKIKEFLPFNKVRCVFAIVLLTDFRMGQHRDDDHQEDASHYIIRVGLGWINSG